ncbi:MAG: DNA (cytosine-5-)-methyltransferase [Lewinellaceae bacterium]|nr:DNA (cytosine-5-)-methyltransferase [Lewinellaceae bacterium]MCB9295734.1 DNA (cytosine-5-)-methyltransferase [Lewinellaceae bacterium]
MKSLEIFSGAGGLALGMKHAGFSHSALVEWNKDACDSLRNNFNETQVFQTDIRKFDYRLFEGVDVISGGPPCQPFSLGGKHRGNMDKRDMFPYAIKGIRETQPKAFIFENVKGLLRQSFSSYFSYIILQLTYPDLIKEKDEDWRDHLARLEKIHTKGNYHGLKYNVVFRLINAANYGVPQKRERVVIVGIKDALNIEWNFPRETHSQERLLWDKYVTGEYWDKLKVPEALRETPTSQMKKTVEKLKAKFGFFKPEELPWVTVREALIDLPDPQSGSNGRQDHIFRDGAKTYPGHTGSFVHDPSKTIKAGDHGVPGGENMLRYEDDSVRYFTVLEAKRIQTFPDEYFISGSWTEAMRQLGNAVPVKLAYTISKELIDKLSHN